jgi:SAM-dependent methyltransferase
MPKLFVNVACGNSFVTGWRNLDYAPVSPAVEAANLLERLPLDDASVDVLYSSHFLEHIPRKCVREFLSECFRVMKPGGQVRLVLPDLEEICREYIRQREAGEHSKAGFVALELIDQCVRSVSGGELGEYYKAVRKDNNGGDIASYIAVRTGEDVLRTPVVISMLSWSNLLRAFRQPGRVIGQIERIYCRFVTWFLPSAFREQNVSFTQVGERHAWIYDFYELSILLEQAGFVSCRKLHFNESGIEGFPLSGLDMNAYGHPRKGLESMYVEARKP